jgi:hypothetical protein
MHPKGSRLFLLRRVGQGCVGYGKEVVHQSKWLLVQTMQPNKRKHTFIPYALAEVELSSISTIKEEQMFENPQCLKKRVMAESN